MSHSSNSSAKPSVFATRQALYELAGRKSWDLMGARHQVIPLRAEQYFGPEIYELALRTSGVISMLDKEVLLTFMEVEARDLLTRMPNAYWFWAVLQQTLSCSDQVESCKITRQEVLDGLTAIRRDMGYKYNLRQKLADLSDEGQPGRRESRIASRAMAGVVLVELGPFENDKIIDNPVFFETY